MSGRVTRRANRRRNIDGLTVMDWFIAGDRAPGECQALTHSKEFGRLVAEFQLFGPWDGFRRLEGCGCEFVVLPGVIVR